MWEQISNWHKLNAVLSLKLLPSTGNGTYYSSLPILNNCIAMLYTVTEQPFYTKDGCISEADETMLLSVHHASKAIY